MIHVIKNDNHNLTGKIHSMTIGYETLQNVTERLPARSHTVEISNQNLLKISYKLEYRASLQEDNLHIIQIIS